MNSELISLIANLALTLSFIVAVIFGIAQVRAAARDRSERLTIDTLHNFQTREFAELMQFITTQKSVPSREEWKKLPDKDQMMYMQFAQQMESLGILVAENLINIDLVDKTIGSLVSIAWEKYKPMMLDSRENIPDPYLGEYFQWLAEQVDKRMTENPRKPFYKTKMRAPSARHKRGHSQHRPKH